MIWNINTAAAAIRRRKDMELSRENEKQRHKLANAVSAETSKGEI
jgi:hypothetical protein